MAVSTEQIVIGAVLAVVALYVFKDYIIPEEPVSVDPKTEVGASVKEGFENGNAVEQAMAPEQESLDIPPSAQVVPKSIKYLEDKRQTSSLESEDLLPEDSNSTWSNVDPKGQGSVAYKQWLEAGYHFGVNTIGSSLKNANKDFRSEPTNPQEVVAPWNQSSVEPDLLRRQLE